MHVSVRDHVKVQHLERILGCIIWSAGSSSSDQKHTTTVSIKKHTKTCHGVPGDDFGHVHHSDHPDDDHKTRTPQACALNPASIAAPAFYWIIQIFEERTRSGTSMCSNWRTWNTSDSILTQYEKSTNSRDIELLLIILCYYLSTLTLHIFRLS